METKTVKFEKKYLWRDNTRALTIIGDYNDNYIKKLNAHILSLEKIVDLKLSDEQKYKMQSEGINSLLEVLKESFPYKKAADDFNYLALGIVKDDLFAEAARFNPPAWQYKAALSNGVFVKMADSEAKILEDNTFYTQNEKQNKAVELGKELEKLMDKFEEEGFVNPNGRYNISRVVSFMRTSLIPEIDGHRIRINGAVIQDLI